MPETDEIIIERSELKDVCGNPIFLDRELRVFLDDRPDVRFAPEGWVYLRTAREVCLLMMAANVVEASLDNDLGGLDPGREDVEGKGQKEIPPYEGPVPDVIFGSGVEVIKFLLEQQGLGNTLWPRDGISIHSANVPAAEWIESSLAGPLERHFGISVTVTPTGTKRHFAFSIPTEDS